MGRMKMTGWTSAKEGGRPAGRNDPLSWLFSLLIFICATASTNHDGTVLGFANNMVTTRSGCMIELDPIEVVMNFPMTPAEESDFPKFFLGVQEGDNHLASPYHYSAETMQVAFVNPYSKDEFHEDLQFVISIVEGEAEFTGGGAVGCEGNRRVAGRLTQGGVVDLKINDMTKTVKLLAGWATGHEAVRLTPQLVLEPEGGETAAGGGSDGGDSSAAAAAAVDAAAIDAAVNDAAAASGGGGDQVTADQDPKQPEEAQAQEEAQQQEEQEQQQRQQEEKSQEQAAAEQQADQTKVHVDEFTEQQQQQQQQQQKEAEQQQKKAEEEEAERQKKQQEQEERRQKKKQEKEEEKARQKEKQKEARQAEEAAKQEAKQKAKEARKEAEKYYKKEQANQAEMMKELIDIMDMKNPNEEDFKRKHPHTKYPQKKRPTKKKRVPAAPVDHAKAEREMADRLRDLKREQAEARKSLEKEMRQNYPANSYQAFRSHYESDKFNERFHASNHIFASIFFVGSMVAILVLIRRPKKARRDL